MSSGLISCFLCLMRNSSGPFPRLTFAHFSTGSSIQPLSTCCKAASPLHLINSRGLLILAHGAEATSSSLTSVPSLEPLPPPPQKKSPWLFSDLSQLFAYPRARAALAMCSSCRLLLWSWAPSQGHYCPFMGFTV